jgi:hypothetical protein
MKLDKTVRFEGFTFMPHPLDPSKQIQLCIYNGEKNLMFALSEVPEPDVEKAKAGLGAVVPSTRLTRFIQRVYPKNLISLQELKGSIKTAYPDTTFYWYEPETVQ